MYRITFVLGGLEDADLARKAIGVLASALTRADVIYMTAHPEAAGLLRGARLVAEPQGDKPSGVLFWQDVPTAIAERHLGPVDAVCARVAELRNSGTRAMPMVETKRSGMGAHVHRVVVRLPDGSSFDPSGAGWFRVLPNQRITLVVGLFEGTHDKAISDATLQVFLDALSEIDENYLRRHPETPRLYHSGILYQEEPSGVEDWQDVATCLRKQKADCDDLGPWLAAERRVRDHIASRPVATSQRRKDGGTLYHILAERPDGRREDPSFVLGMR